jgi:SPP1 gp7 family putative phage head morphogenesis protein
MVPFAIPEWRKDQIERKRQRENMVINYAVSETEKVLKNAIDTIVDYGSATGTWIAPSLHQLDNIGESFYRSVISQAYYTCQDEKRAQKGQKRLAKTSLPIGLPKTLRGLEKLFRDKRYWPKIMKRSQKIVDRLRKSYLQKLQRKFKDLMPQIREGGLSINDAKKKMMTIWDASKPRVELIFRTETTTYFGKTQVAFYNDDDEIIGYLFDSVRDIGRTEICKVRHGLIFTKKHKGELSISRNTPSLHYNCRSHLIALANTRDNVKMLSEPARDPENKKAQILKADKMESKIRF